MHSSPDYKDINDALAYISNAVVGQYDINLLLDQIIQATSQILKAEVCSIYLEDKENEPGILKCVAGSGFANKIVGVAKFKIGEGFTGSVAKYGKEHNIKSREELEKLVIDGKKVWRGAYDKKQWPSGASEFRNLLALPLKIKGQILGVIKVENKLEEYGNSFSQEDLATLKIIANVIALAIENTQLHNKIEAQLKTISAKAAHRINNQAANYDGIELDLAMELQTPLCDRENLIYIHDRLKTTTKNLKNMIGEFRNFGKPIQLLKTESSINKIIRDEVWLSQASVSGIQVVEKYDESIPNFSIDGARFAESIKELLLNAKKALTRASDENRQILVSTKLVKENDDKRVVIHIEDNGPGFPPGFPVFEPFNTTDPQSTGLGLSTVKELMESHGGSIIVKESTLGGACIECVLPIPNSK